MSILIDENTKVLIQGITGAEGSFHARQMLEYGTRVVAGVTPGKGGSNLDEVPTFNTVTDAVLATGADASAIFVPPAFAADAIMEAADAGLALVVCLTEGIPILDMIAVRHYLKGRNIRLVGPNTPGLISPGKCKLGVMAGYIHKQGSVGIVSRSGTLTYEVVHQLTRLGLGQSTCVGIGGDPVTGLSFVDILRLFEADDQTKTIVMIGEIGGSQEEEAADYYQANMNKPVIAFITGLTAPKERRMGHAGAIVTGGRGGADEKIKALESAGIIIVKNPAEVGETTISVIRAHYLASGTDL